jgi:DNA-binding transcriptional ArsR family regulator
MIKRRFGRFENFKNIETLYWQYKLDKRKQKAYLNICSYIQGVNMSSAKAKCLDGEACQVRVIHLDQVERARRETVSGKELTRLSSIYKVLGDPSRLKIVMALKNVEMCVCDLAAFLGLTESAISHQLRRFKDLALVKSRREGQVIYYSLDGFRVQRPNCSLSFYCLTSEF